MLHQTFLPHKQAMNFTTQQVTLLEENKIKQINLLIFPLFLAEKVRFHIIFVDYAY